MTEGQLFPSNSEAPSALAPAIPDTVLKKIKNAWIAGVISGCITLVVTLVAISGTSILGFSAWELLDVALVFGLTFGIYKKSRTCAILMLSYFIIAKILLIAETRNVAGIALALVFIYYYWQGVVGTFQYHTLIRSNNTIPPVGG